MIWALRLQEFTFAVEYRNVVPDALSRIPSDQSSMSTCAMVLKANKQETPALVFPFTDEELWRSQQEDKEVQEIYQSILEDGEKLVNSSTKRTIIEDKVYQVIQLPHPSLYQVWIPGPLRSRLMSFFHDDPLSGHLGRYKTYRRLQALVYWPKMSLDVKTYVTNCQICQRYKPECKKPAGKLQQTQATRPWEMLGVDLIGPFPKSSQLNSYLLTFVNYYSKWVEIFPLRRATAEVVSKLMVKEIITRWGVSDERLNIYK